LSALPLEPASCGAPPLFPFPEGKPGVAQYSPQPLLALLPFELEFPELGVAAVVLVVVVDVVVEPAEALTLLPWLLLALLPWLLLALLPWLLLALLPWLLPLLWPFPLLALFPWLWLALLPWLFPGSPNAGAVIHRARRSAAGAAKSALFLLRMLLAIPFPLDPLTPYLGIGPSV
jgi:hypothetical protein